MALWLILNSRRFEPLTEPKGQPALKLAIVLNDLYDYVNQPAEVESKEVL